MLLKLFGICNPELLSRGADYKSAAPAFRITDPEGRRASKSKQFSGPGTAGYGPWTEQRITNNE
jgi:hypothetical protein